MKYKAVIFDLDGTLLDTLEDLADAMNRVLRGKGFPTHSTEAYRYFVGNGAAKLVSRTLPPDNRNDELEATCLEAFRDEYTRGWNVKTRPYEGVQELLDALTTRRIEMAVLSNKPQRFTELCVQEYLPGWKFALVFGQSDRFPLKPDPASALEIARRMDVPPREFLYLGDTATDMKTAVAAGMFPVGALWGFRSEEELREAGAVGVIGRPAQLLDLMD